MRCAVFKGGLRESVILACTYQTNTYEAESRSEEEGEREKICELHGLPWMD